MARAITVTNAVVGANLVFLTADADCNVVGFISTNESILTRDVSAGGTGLVSGFKSPSLSQIEKQCIAYSGGAKSAPNGPIPPVGILAGESLAVSFSAAGSALIYLDP